MTHTAAPNLARRLKRKAVSKAHSVRLDRRGATVLQQLQTLFKGKGEYDIPAASVIFRRCLNVYGQKCGLMDAPALANERAALIADTYLPVKQTVRKPSSPA